MKQEDIDLVNQDIDKKMITVEIKLDITTMIVKVGVTVIDTVGGIKIKIE